MSPRQGGVAAQALRTAVWVIATPIAAWVALKRPRFRWVAALVWTGLLLWCELWWWPSPPKNVYDTDAPLWHRGDGVILWVILVAALGVWIYTAFRSGDKRQLAPAITLLGLISVLSVISLLVTYSLARNERSMPTAQGRVELAALRADPIWGALPLTPAVTAHGEHGSATTVWGEKVPTTVWRYQGNRYDITLFLASVAAAEESGWVLRGTSCFENNWDAVLSKTLSVGQARMRIALATYTKGVGIDVEVAEIGYAGKPGRCWDHSGPNADQ